MAEELSFPELPSDEFKKHYGSIHAYLEQYVKIATKGNVDIEWALHVARMRLGCKVCGLTLTAPEPKGTEVDYGIQEFVKIHSHAGGHKSCTCGGTGDPVTGKINHNLHALQCPAFVQTPCIHGYLMWQNACDICREVKLGIKNKAVTADFKNVPFTPLPPVAKDVLEKIKAAALGGSMGDIDLKHSMASLIAQQMKSYDKEYAEKMSDENLAKKIAALQSADYAGELAKGMAELKAKGLMSPEDTEVIQEKIQDSKAELQALQNILTLKAMQKKKQQLLGAISGEHPVTVIAPPKKDKPLKIATGRKFR